MVAIFSAGLAAQQPPELVIRMGAKVVDGDLADWPANSAAIELGEETQLVVGSDLWAGPADSSARFLISADNNHLYVAGTVRDQQLQVGGEAGLVGRTDRIEISIAPVSGEDGIAAAADVATLYLQPLHVQRPWKWAADSGQQEGGLRRQAGTQLAGLSVAARRISDDGYVFEAAIPFHHVPDLLPGARLLRLGVVLRDFDADRAGAATLSWCRTAGGEPGLGLVRLPGPGLLSPTGASAPLLSSDLLLDLPYLLVPFATLLVMVFMLRGWARVRNRTRWLRPLAIAVGVATFAIGLGLPRWLASWRAGEQRQQLEATAQRFQAVLGKLEAGTLASYRGASRDRAVMDLLAGRTIARQRFTRYRPLVEIAPDQFGPPLREFDDLPLRTYWLPLVPDRKESFQFDPPLRGNKLHLVVARPFVPTFSFAARSSAAPALSIELDYGVTSQSRRISLDLPFADSSPLGREFWEACVISVACERDVRALTLGCLGAADLRLVGVSLESEEPGRVVPVLLGGPSRDGVLTDLRGPYPMDAGIELAPGASAKVVIPPTEEPPQRLWFFYRAIYPGQPTANPGARVAEIALHFADGRPKRTLLLEHQISMFYELAVHNTRDDPPEGSPASIALTWIDEGQERHVNLGYQVADLPVDAGLAAIEFRNLADYRMRFRSVVFVNERAAAPQDPPDSPLLRDGNIERRLRPEVLADLQGTALSIYRGGRLSESTLPMDQRGDVQTLPRAVGAAEAAVVDVMLPSGGRRVSLFTPLRGVGWDGAVLGVSAVDESWTAAAQSDNRTGLLLCLVGTPLLLVLLSELLAAVANLRIRLMTVMSVASLAPLGLMSLVLLRVLESGHATEVEEGARATVSSAMAQLDEQKARLQASARQWLRDLTLLAADKLADVEESRLPAAAPALGEELQKLLSGQLPPDWQGGFLRLEWQPTTRPGSDPLVLLVGDERMVAIEAPARLEPGLFMQWGQLMLGVRAEHQVRGTTFALTAGRPLDGKLLGSLAPGRDLLLTDVRGYPLASSSGRPEGTRLWAEAFDPPTMAARERSLAIGDESRQTVCTRSSSPLGDYVLGSEVLRDLQDTPRGLLVVALPDERATLELAIGRIPVRAFFLLVAGSLVVLSAFLSFVVSGRISGPIEQLERGAQALSRGALEARVPLEEGGQIGRLTRTFNKMAADLQGRLQDLQALNRTMGELAREHDEASAIAVLRRFCRSHTSADVVSTLLLDEAGHRLAVHGGSSDPEHVSLGDWPLAAHVGPFSCRAAPLGPPAPWDGVLAGCRSLVGLPIVFAGQARGVVLLGFAVAEPLRVELELLTTVVAQAASACERAQLRRLAVRDPLTGMLAPDYFHRRLADEVALRQRGGGRLALLALLCDERQRWPRSVQGFAVLLGEQLPGTAFACQVGNTQFQLVLPGMESPEVERLAARIGSSWRSWAGEGAPTMRHIAVVFPDDAPSAELLLECLRNRIAASGGSDDAGAESDESLRQAGVTAISPAMRPVLHTLRRVAPTDLPILLEGETGVGKEVLTNLVHRWSRRAHGPLVKLHCASLSETLLASELFGHERGAFTGAERRKIGRFEQADGGTLFLDEVGEIPLDVQVKLLRVLQEGEIDRVGGSEPVKVDVRVITATNRDIASMVRAGRFREDLYYRLQGMVVHVPPLRERKAELAQLIEVFRHEIVRDGHAPERTLSSDAIDELYRQDWPGNIRQLRTTVFRAMVLAQGPVVMLHDVVAALATETQPAVRASGVPVALPLGPAETAGATATPAAGAHVAAVGAVAHDATEAAAPATTVAENGAAMAGPAMPTASSAVVLPRPAGVRTVAAAAAFPPALDPADLPPRLQALLAAVLRNGRLTTQDHMAATGVSHRTALRDLQGLVQLGLLVRVGSRRGAHYRPSGAASSWQPGTAI